jgi:dUTPase
MEGINVYVKRLSTNATIPVRGSEGAAGADLFSAVNTVVRFCKRAFRALCGC